MALIGNRLKEISLRHQTTKESVMMHQSGNAL